MPASSLPFQDAFVRLKQQKVSVNDADNQEC